MVASLSLTMQTHGLTDAYIIEQKKEKFSQNDKL